MEVAQYNKLKWDFLIGAIAISAACGFSLFLITGYANPAPEPVVCVSLLLCAVVIDVLSVLEWHSQKQKVIRIDETGISLKRKGKLEWAFRWDEIERIRYSNPYRHRGIAFELKNPPKIDLWTVSRPHLYQFHLNKTAREALKCYCKLPIQK